MLKEYILTSQNAEGVHGQRKVGNPWSKMTQCILKAVSLAPRLELGILDTSVTSCQNECNKVNIGQYVKTIMT